MIISSPPRPMKPGGGTIAVPVSSTTPTGKPRTPDSPRTRPAGRRHRPVTLTVSLNMPAPFRTTLRLTRSSLASGNLARGGQARPTAQLPVYTPAGGQVKQDLTHDPARRHVIAGQVAYHAAAPADDDG